MKNMAGMRHRLIHIYRDVDPDVVWDTAQKFLPEIRDEINRILNQ